MFLRALYDHAVENLELPAPGYGDAYVRYLVEVGSTGPRMVDTSQVNNSWLNLEGSVAKLSVPRLEVQRSVGIKPCLLADKGEYVFGVPRSDTGSRRSVAEQLNAVSERHRSFLALLDECYTETRDWRVLAVIEFYKSYGGPFESGAIGEIPDPVLGLLQGIYGSGAAERFNAVSRISFTVEGELVSDVPEVVEFWSQRSLGNPESEGQCMITGEVGPVVDKMIGTVRGLPGLVPTGARLISFNRGSFEGHGLSGMQNAPLSPKAARAIDAGLTDLLSRGENRLLVGDSVNLFWGSPAASDGGQQHNGTGNSGTIDFGTLGGLLRSILYGPGEGDTRDQMSDLLRRVSGVEEIVADGEPYVRSELSYESGAKVEISHLYRLAEELRNVTSTGGPELGLGMINALALEGRSARVAVRSFTRRGGEHMVGAAARFILAQRVPDMYSDIPVAPKGIMSLLEELGPDGAEGIPERLGDGVVRAVLGGGKFGGEVVTGLARRSRFGGFSTGGAQLAKLILVSKGVLCVDDLVTAGDVFHQESGKGGSEDGLVGPEAVFLDVEDRTAFVLGRLLGLLDQIQQVVLRRRVGLSVSARHYGVCAVSPKAGFGRPLQYVYRDHLPSVHRRDPRQFHVLRAEMSSLMGCLPDQFPGVLDAHRQLIFGLGYRYQEADRQARVRKSARKRNNAG